MNLSRKSIAALAAGVTLGAGLLAAAPLASAASLTSTQIGAIVNLLQAFGADSSTIATVQSVLQGTGGTTGTSTPAANGGFSLPPQASNCAVISTSLHVGETDSSTGGEVTRLQQFLAKDKSVYPEGIVSGYFGKLTEDAVQRWQSTHNIVASGTPATTGFGLVGPHTRSALNGEMEKECESEGHNWTNGSSTPSEGEHGKTSSESSNASTTSNSSDNTSSSTDSQGG